MDSISFMVRGQAQKRPNQIVISQGDKQLTYRSLVQKMDRCAVWHNSFSTKGVVFILIKELIHLLPLTLSIPEERIFFIIASDISKTAWTSLLQHHSPSLIITTKKSFMFLPATSVPIVFIEDESLMFKDNYEYSPRNHVHGKTYLIEKVEGCNRVIRLDNLAHIFKVFDKIIQPRESDKMLMSTDIPLFSLLIESIWCLAKGIPLAFETGPMHLLSSRLTDDNHFPMDFSLFYFGSHNFLKAPDKHKYDLVLKTVEYADQNEYKAVWTPERHFNGFGGLFPNPSVLSAALAVKTKYVLIKTGSIVAPLHNTIRMAEDWAVIDNLSEGRVAISFASGWQCDDFVFFPDRYATRHELMFQQISELKTLWAGEGITRQNGLGQSITVKTYPRPLQRELPVWVTVSSKKESFEEAGKIGANVLTHLLWQNPNDLVDKIRCYRTARMNAGFDPDSGIVSVMLHTFLGDEDDRVKDIVQSPLKEYIKSSVYLIELMTNRINKEKSDGEKIGRYGGVHKKVESPVLEEVLDLAFHRFYERAGLLGTIEQGISTIKRLRSYGVNELACLIDFGLPLDAVMRSLKYLTELKKRYNTRLTGKDDYTILRGKKLPIKSVNEGKRNKIRKLIIDDACGIIKDQNTIVMTYQFEKSGNYFLPSLKDPGEPRNQIVKSNISEDF